MTEYAKRCARDIAERIELPTEHYPDLFRDVLEIYEEWDSGAYTADERRGLLLGAQDHYTRLVR